jgi:hypothetical protein
VDPAVVVVEGEPMVQEVADLVEQTAVADVSQADREGVFLQDHMVHHIPGLPKVVLYFVLITEETCIIITSQQIPREVGGQVLLDIARIELHLAVEGEGD